MHQMLKNASELQSNEEQNPLDAIPNHISPIASGSSHKMATLSNSTRISSLASARAASCVSEAASTSTLSPCIRPQHSLYACASFRASFHVSNEQYFNTIQLRSVLYCTVLLLCTVRVECRVDCALLAKVRLTAMVIGNALHLLDQ